MSKFIKSVLSSVLVTIFLSQTHYQFFLHAEAVQNEHCDKNGDSHATTDEVVRQDQHQLNLSVPPRNDDCRCPPHTDGARIAYFITLHNKRTLHECLTLLKSIVAPNFIILIHIDKKLPKEEYENGELIRYANEKTCDHCGAYIRIESLFNAEWGKWSMMDPTIWAMQQLVESPQLRDKWDVFINLSADSMPVYTPNVISGYFDGPLKGINFVTSSSCTTGLLPTNIDLFPKGWHKSKHYKEKGDFEITYNTKYDADETEDKNMETVTLTIHFGSQWMSLSRSFVEYIASSMNRNDSLPYQFKEALIKKGRLMADETFIATILANHPTFKTTLPILLENNHLASMEGMSAIRYERMDEHAPDAFMNVVEEQRYEVPQAYEGIIDVPRPWGPYYLGIYDLGKIKDSGALFIRKVAKELDSNLFNLLPVNHKDQIPDIRWPNNVKVSSKITF